MHVDDGDDALRLDQHACAYMLVAVVSLPSSSSSSSRQHRRRGRRRRRRLTPQLPSQITDINRIVSPGDVASRKRTHASCVCVCNPMQTLVLHVHAHVHFTKTAAANTAEYVLHTFMHSWTRILLLLLVLLVIRRHHRLLFLLLLLLLDRPSSVSWPDASLGRMDGRTDGRSVRLTHTTARLQPPLLSVASPAAAAAGNLSAIDLVCLWAL